MVKKALPHQCSTFHSLYEQGLISKSILKYTESKGFTSLSPVQEAVIPQLILRKNDLAVEACTGSGKTLAFLVPVVELTLRHHRTQAQASHCDINVSAVCIAPTRELALQIQSVLRDIILLGNVPGINDLILTGGKEQSHDLDKIAQLKETLAKQDSSSAIRSTIIISTSGRFAALIESSRKLKFFNLSQLHLVIFDEADRLFENFSSFHMQIADLLSYFPKDHKTALFSATLTAEIQSLVKAGLKSPCLVRVSVDSSSKTQLKQQKIHALPLNLKLYAVYLDRSTKFACLTQLLCSRVKLSKAQKPTTSIVFFSTCALAEFAYRIYSQIFHSTLNFERLHRRMNQQTRSNSFKRFIADSPSKLARVLFATDLAARGLDFPSVHLIVQFDAPTVIAKAAIF